MAIPEEPKAGIPDWVLTYGDLMSLLLCFFVLIASFSQIKEKEPRIAVIRSILKQFGNRETLSRFNSSVDMNRTERKKGESTRPLNIQTSDRKRGAKGADAQPGESDRVSVVQEGRRQIISGPAIFAEGSAELLPEAKAALKQASIGLRGKWHLIDVEGFEPPGELPLSSKFATPLDLAYARVRAVVDFLAK